MYQQVFRPQHKPAGSIEVAPVIYCDANTNALTSYSHISPPPGQFITPEQKDQGLDTDQDIAIRVGAERAAKDHMPPTMFRLVRTTVLLVSDTIYPCFVRMALVGLCGCGLLNLLDGRSRSRSDAPLSRYPLPKSAVDIEVGEQDGKHLGSSRV